MNNSSWAKENYLMQQNMMADMRQPPPVMPQMMQPPPAAMPQMMQPPPAAMPQMMQQPPPAMPQMMQPPPPAMPGMMQPPPPLPNMMMPPPLVPPSFMMSDMNIMPPTPAAELQEQGQGQSDMVLDDDEVTDDEDEVQVVGEERSKDSKGPKDRSRRGENRGRESRRDRRGRERDRRSPDRERGRQQRYRSRERHDRKDSQNKRNGRHKSRDSDDHKRSSKRDGDVIAPAIPLPAMPPYGINNQMICPPPDLATVPCMPNMLSGMDMIPGMVDQQTMMNMMMSQQMMTQPVIQPNQTVYISNAMLLPPLPGTSLPKPREKPKGCRTISVGGLPAEITEEMIREVFQRFGEISSVKLHPQGVGHVRYEKEEVIDVAFQLSGFRFKCHNQMEMEATTMYIDYALNREDYAEYERSRHKREPTPPPVVHCTPINLADVAERIRSDDQFGSVAATIATWLERGECDKKNVATFYKLIQTSHNQSRRLYTEKMALDEEFQTMKSTIREKFRGIVNQFEQVAKILAAARVQRVSDHFTKPQRRNIEMWHKMSEDLEIIKEEFYSACEDDEAARSSKNMVSSEKYEALKAENQNLAFEMEGYKNEAHLAKDEAERKFEKFKAQFIAQQALNSNTPKKFTQPPPPLMVKTPSEPDEKLTKNSPVPPYEGKLISMLTAFLMVHPLGASLDYLVSYVKSMVPDVTQVVVREVLTRHKDVFRCQKSGVGASIEHKWGFVAFDNVKKEV